MAYKLKEEYKGLIMNFPELGMRNLTTDEMNDASIQAKLMRTGHAGYYEPEEPIDLNIEIVVDEELKKKQDADRAKEAELKAKAEAEIQSQLTASTSKEAKTAGKKSAKPAKKKK